MWGQIGRFAKSAAKRADDIGHFLERFKRRMGCDAINPRWMDTGVKTGRMVMGDTGEIIQFGNQERNFMTEIIESPIETQREVINAIYEQTQRVLLLVRDRIEREKPLDLKEGAAE